MKKSGLQIFILLLVLAHTLYAAPGDKTSAPRQTDKERHTPALIREMEAVMAEYQVPGMAMAVRFCDGTLLEYAAGSADTSTGEALTPQHHFRIGSASKTVTATAVLLLCQEGHFSLDNDIALLLPELEESNPGSPLHGRGITVKMLLQHTSGLKDYIDGEFSGEDMIDILIREPLRPWRPEDLVAVSFNMGLEPIDQFEYSNTNYVILGMLIEKFSGLGYARFVKEKILDPLSLSQTLVPEGNGLPQPYAHGYFEKDMDKKLYDYSAQNPSAVWSAGNIISTPGDLLCWLEALTEGRLLGPEMGAQQFTLRPFPEAGIAYGLGVASFDGAVGHNGTVMGYQTWMTRYHGASIVAYNNCHYLTKNVHISNILFERIKKILCPSG